MLIREAGIRVGTLTPGPFNAITDVPGVRVGHATLLAGDGPLKPGFGPVRTGVTVILPHEGDLFNEKVRCAVYTINGFGKACGFEQVRELGLLEAPVALTNTLNVGLVLDALVQYAIRQTPQIGIHTSTVNIVVGETNDGYLNDIQGRHVKAEHVWQALEQAAGGAVAEGVVGAGAGTVCFGWKGGIGTASRVIPASAGGFTLGALVQTNFGNREDLLVCGIPVGRELRPPDTLVSQEKPTDSGSVMIILATNAPLSALQLRRLCLRSAAGLARCGAYYGHGSGDFALAFSTANKIPHRSSHLISTEQTLGWEELSMNALFRAVVESVEEAVLNSLTCAHTVTGRDNHVAYGLPVAQLLELLKKDGAL